MPAEKVTLHRANINKTELIEQYPKTIVDQVYDFENGKFLNETLSGVNQHLTQLDERGKNKHVIVQRALEKPRIMAHRALSNVYPENTLPAFYECARTGIVFFETDFRKTSDGHFVCIHDETTTRTTGTNLTVATSTLAQLRELKQSLTIRSAFYDNPLIPTLDEVFEFIKFNDVIVNVNFDYGISNEDIPFIINKIYEYGIADKVIMQNRFSNFDKRLCVTKNLPLTDAAYKEAGEDGNVIAAYDYAYGPNLTATRQALVLADKYKVPIVVYTAETYSAFRGIDPTGVHLIMVDNHWNRKGN